MLNYDPIRVVVADDQPLIRSGLSAFLRVFGELQLVGEANDGEDVLQLCELVEPDVVLMDVDMPRLGGLAATRAIRQRWSNINVIVLGDSKEESDVQAALEAGAAGYLSKDISADDLARTIKGLYENDPQARRQIQPETAEPETTEPQSLERMNMAQELAAAGRIQAGILPAEVPIIRGWDLAARLEPARETSGDFFDFIPLPNGDWGIVIADVTDKGIGAALFTALCSTLIRTYATQYPTLPGIVLNTVNDRILTDTRGDMFVTVFYGVLEPDTGRLRYVNAGHNPPYLISCKKGKPVDRLRPTGMALGVMDDAHWAQKTTRFTPGDLLVLYTDGITEAQDPRGRFFGEERLLRISRTFQGHPAREIQDALLTEVHRFSGDDQLHDDVALLVVARK